MNNDNKMNSNNKTKVKKLALTLAVAQVFSILPALPISDVVGLNNGSKVYAAEPQTEYRWGKYSKETRYETKYRTKTREVKKKTPMMIVMSHGVIGWNQKLDSILKKDINPHL